MILSLEPLSERQAQAICAWKYEPPYDIYALSPWEDMQKTETELADPLIRECQYRAVVNENRELCGFAQFFPLQGWIRLGLGMRPDLCGQGLGAQFVRVIVEEAKRKAPAQQIDLEVLSWNERAYKVYVKCGFRYEQTYERMTPTGPAAFHCMIYSN